MKRIAFKMFLLKGNEAEYQKRHDAIWPELATLLSENGVSDYSIFLDEETGVLYGSLKLADELAFSHLPAHPIMKKWWMYMKDIMQSNEDHSPVSVPLKEVFYLP